MVLIFQIFASNSRADNTIVVQNKNESDISFVERVTMRHITPEFGEKQIARTTKLGKEMLISFVESSPYAPPRPVDNEHDIELHIFIRNHDSNYLQTKTVACNIEGGNPTIESFFYLNVDSDPQLEIGVICGWHNSHAAAECQTINEIKFFKLHDDNVQAVSMEKYKALLYGEKKPDKKSDFTCKYTKFKTAADVKKLFKSKP